jgi:hypothetical protein
VGKQNRDHRQYHYAIASRRRTKLPQLFVQKFLVALVHFFGLSLFEQGSVLSNRAAEETVCLRVRFQKKIKLCRSRDIGPQNAFIFCILNSLEDLIVNVLIPKVGVARQLGEDKRHEVNLTVTQLGGELPLQLWPNLKPQK